MAVLAEIFFSKLIPNNFIWLPQTWIIILVFMSMDFFTLTSPIFTMNSLLVSYSLFTSNTLHFFNFVNLLRTLLIFVRNLFHNFFAARTYLVQCVSPFTDASIAVLMTASIQSRHFKIRNLLEANCANFFLLLLAKDKLTVLANFVQNFFSLAFPHRNSRQTTLAPFFRLRFVLLLHRLLVKKFINAGLLHNVAVYFMDFKNIS